MLYARIRILLIFVFLVTGTILHFKGTAGAWYLYLAGVILLVTQVIFGNVWSAFSLLKKGKVQAAEKLVNFTKFPRLLLPQHRAYYHFCKGLIALQHKDFANGKTNLKTALDLGLRTDNDNAMAALNLAHLFYVQKDYPSAKKHLKQAKRFPTNDLLLKENIEKLTQILQKQS